MPVILVGVNHTTAPVALREQLYIGGSTLQPFLEQLGDSPDVEEIVVLSTCNRSEVYVAGNSSEALVLALAKHAGVCPAELRPHIYIYEGPAAVRHLFRVVCGLDSLVVGEVQILGQVRDALEKAREHGSTGRQLTGLFQQAVAVGKRARTETSISAGAFSVARTAVELVLTLVPDIGNSHILLLGAGKMAELTAKHLMNYGVKSIFVANRTHEHASELAEQLGGQAIHYAELEHFLPKIDVVISSTGAPHIVLYTTDIARAMELRDGRPLCLIDIAVPRDIEPSAGELPNVHLHNIDDLQAVTAKDHSARLSEVPQVEMIIGEAIDRWRHWQAGLEVAPFLCSLRDSFEDIRRGELERASGFLTSLTPEQQAQVEYLTSSLVNKILHTPTLKIKETLARRQETTSIALLCELFAIPEKLSEKDSLPDDAAISVAGKAEFRKCIEPYIPGTPTQSDAERASQPAAKTSQTVSVTPDKEEDR
ncbi:MAG: glutamyl-tRNA reductase [Armatimonadota bacterium]